MFVLLREASAEHIGDTKTCSADVIRLTKRVNIPKDATGSAGSQFYLSYPFFKVKWQSASNSFFVLFQF